MPKHLIWKLVDELYGPDYIREEILEINLLILEAGEESIEQSLRRRIALVCLEVIRNSDSSKNSLLNLCYDLMIFSDYLVGDELESIMEDIRSIALDRKIEEPLVYLKWRTIQEKIYDYLLS